AALVADVVERHEIHHGTFEPPRRHASEAAVAIGSERLDILRVHDLAAQHQRPTAPSQAQQVLKKRTIGHRPDLELSTLPGHLLSPLSPRRISLAASAPSPASFMAAAIAAAAWG